MVCVLNGLWTAIVLLAMVWGSVNGKMGDVNAALLSGGSEALTLMVTLGGSMCVWSGFLRVADCAGITRALSRALSPLLRVLFPDLSPDSDACRAMSMNMAANVLGLGNAATPLGLNAMRCLQRGNPHPERATRDMVVFVVLNTASVQLLPTTVAAIRLEAGAPDPMNILPAVWVTSIGSALAAVLVARLSSTAETTLSRVRRAHV